MRIVGILLAAGAGVRFGGGKLLARLPDRTTVGYRSCANLHAALDEVIAVVRPGDAALSDELKRAGADVTVCADASDGMGHSLAHAVRHAGDFDACIVALADMPWIATRTIQAVAACLEKGASLVVPRYRGERGHPVGFGSTHKAALMALTGDSGAKSIIATATDTEWLDVEDPGVLRDVDRPADLDSSVGRALAKPRK